MPTVYRPRTIFNWIYEGHKEKIILLPSGREVNMISTAPDSTDATDPLQQLNVSY